MGDEWQLESFDGLETRMRLPAILVGGLQRGNPASRARPRFAYAPASSGNLQSLYFNILLEANLRPGGSLCRSIIYSSALPFVDRLLRHSRRIHAGEGDRLFREQSPRDLRATTVCDQQSARVQRLW